MLINCPTEKAILLLGVSSKSGAMRFPSSYDRGDLLGIVVDVKPLVPINEQLMDAVRNIPELAKYVLHVVVEQNFYTQLDVDGEECTLYIATLSHEDVEVNTTWKTLPDFLGDMPKDRRRVAYLKAFQVLSGALTYEVSAIDFKELENIIKS